MSFDSSDLETLIALDAAGALTEQERRSLEAALADAGPAARDFARDAYETAARVGAAVPRTNPSPNVRDVLMSRLGPRFTFIAADEGWTPYQMPGVDVKVLSMDRSRDSITMLMRVSPGTRYPAHHHSGPEDCYVLSGDVTILGRRLGPGDFHHADAGTTHSPIVSEGGATVLLVVPASDYMPDDRDSR